MRLDNWPSLLAEFLRQRETAAFQYGFRDCSLFAADAVLCMTGIDPARDLRGRYKTELGAARLLKLHGGLPGIMEKIAQDQGMAEIHPKSAQRGDVVLIGSPLGDALALIDLSGEVAGQSIHGVTKYPISEVKRAWRVG